MYLARDRTSLLLWMSLLIWATYVTQADAKIDSGLRSSNGRNIVHSDNTYQSNGKFKTSDTLKRDNTFLTDSNTDYIDPQKNYGMKNNDFKSSNTPSVTWAKSFGSLSEDSVQAMWKDANDNIYMTGIFAGSFSIAGSTIVSNGGYDFFVMRISTTGSVESIFSFGGTGDDWANAITGTLDGNLTIVGEFSGTWTAGDFTVASATGTDSDIFVLQITPQGEVVWLLSVGGTGDDVANDIGVLSTGEMVVAGSFQQYIDFGPLGTIYSNGQDDMLILWIHPIGVVMSYKNYGSTQLDTATGVAVSQNLGQIGVCGVFNGYIVVEGDGDNSDGSDMMIILYWNNGTFIDEASFNSGLDDGLQDVLVDTAGNFYVVGYYTNGEVAAVGGRDMAILKFSGTATFMWYKLFGGPLDDVAYSIGVDEEGNVFVVGATGGDIDFGGGPLPSKGSSDLFLLKLTPAGNFLEASTFGGVGNDTGRAVTVVNGFPIIAGTFDNSLKLGHSTLHPVGAQDIMYFKVNLDGSSSEGGSKKSNAGVIAAAVIVPVVAVGVLGAVGFVALRRRNAYRKKVMEIASQPVPNTAQNIYQPVTAHFDNMSNHSLASQNSSNQFISRSGANSVENNNYEAIGSHSSSSNVMIPAEVLEMMKAQGINDLSNSSWLIDFKQIQLQQKIGSGAFGAVFKGIWRGVPVAVKQSNTDMAIQDFLSEAEILQKLRPHPNITQFLGVCPQPFCLVFEFVPNGSLFSFLMNKSKTMDNNLKIRILRGVVAGMIHLHSEGIVHRDLAARNILLDGTFTPKVCDFGLSRATGVATMGQTASEIGPIKWMAPEAILQRLYGPKTDVWSFGVVIFEVLERNIPYPDLSVPQVAAYIMQISLMESIPQNNNHPPELLDIMKLCLQLEPEKRPTFEQLILQFDEKLPQEH